MQRMPLFISLVHQCFEGTRFRREVHSNAEKEDRDEKEKFKEEEKEEGEVSEEEKGEEKEAVEDLEGLMGRSSEFSEKLGKFSPVEIVAVLLVRYLSVFQSKQAKWHFFYRWDPFFMLAHVLWVQREAKLQMKSQKEKQASKKKSEIAAPEDRMENLLTSEFASPSGPASNHFHGDEEYLPKINMRMADRKSLENSCKFQVVLLYLIKLYQIVLFTRKVQSVEGKKIWLREKEKSLESLLSPALFFSGPAWTSQWLFCYYEFWKIVYAGFKAEKEDKKFTSNNKEVTDKMKEIIKKHMLEGDVNLSQRADQLWEIAMMGVKSEKNFLYLNAGKKKTENDKPFKYPSQKNAYQKKYPPQKPAGRAKHHNKNFVSKYSSNDPYSKWSNMGKDTKKEEKSESKDDNEK